MKGLKKFLFFFLILFAFGFSNENKDSKVMLDKVRETSQLKIGVTKIKSKELPMEFDVESKKVYGEIEITDNDLVFVSETLDEIPSVSTTNGRRVINNINKYLTKNIKESPKFNYQIVDGKTESGEKNGKKYLLIDCKEQLSSVYVYVLEKGSYKIKNVYKGAFKQLFLRTVNETYGNLNIESDIINKDYRKITIKSGNLYVSKPLNYNLEDTEVKAGINLSGKFPERVLYETLKQEGGGKNLYIRAIVTSKYGKDEKEIKLSESNGGYSDYKAILTLKDSTGQDSTLIGIISSDEHNSEKYLSIFIKRPRPFEDDEYKVELKYGYYGGIFNGTFYELINHRFNINIKGDGEQFLPIGTDGKILFDKPEPFLTKSPTIIGGNVNGEKETPNIDNSYILKEEYRNTGKFLKKPLNGEMTVNKIQDGVDLKISLDTSTIEGLNESATKTIKLKTNGTDIWDGKIAETTFNLYDVLGKSIGKIGVFSDSETDEYYKIKITGWDDSFTHQVVEAKITLIYEKVINRGKHEKRKIIKKDTYTIIISPREEIIPANTRETLIITNPTELAGHDIYIDVDGKVGIRRNVKHRDGKGKPGTFKKEQLMWSGKIPEKFVTINKKEAWVNWGKNPRLIIRGDNGFGEKKTEPEIYDYKTGNFKSVGLSGDEGWNEIKSVKGKHIGWIYFSITDRDEDSKTIVIGFCGGVTNPLYRRQMEDITEETGNVIYRFEFAYQVQVGNEWIDKKVDVLDLVIQPELPVSSPKIKLNNPLVYYDYNSSSAISNIIHNRRVHLAKDEATTLNNNGSKFIKNISLDGEEWIIPSSEVRDYPWETLGKHKLSINRGTNEVIKITKEDGGTNSSTYLRGDGVNAINGSKNEVMFSYDGGNRYLNFGLSKYNFDGEKINDIVITNYDDKSLESRITYSVDIPPFEGIHYVGNYDIRPRQSYTKDYEYNPKIAYTEDVIINYGIVGFRNLDTRITEQSGGEGIDLRTTTKVKLVSEKNPNYVITGARLYFEKDEADAIKEKNPIETSIFKGENEKATSAMLKLFIPRQERLIPQGKFKILVDDEINKEKNNKNPLRVGVTVKGNDEKYYTYIGANKRGEIGKDLYLNLKTKRFVETIIEFENPNLKTDAQGENWIKLNKSNFESGTLSRDIEGSNIWGRVRGDIIDIPIKKADGTLYNLKMTLFDENKEKVLIDNLNTKDGSKKIEFGTNKNFIIGRENLEDNYIRFTLDNGYEISDIGKEIKFYIRYLDTTTNEKGDFLFDQRYIVKFKKEAKYKGDTTIILKNPITALSNLNDDGMIDVTNIKSLGKDNSNTKLDFIKWYKIINPIKYPETNLVSVTRIEDNTEIQDYNKFLKLQKGVLYFGIPNNKADFETIFGKYDGEKIEKSFELKFASDNSNSYRLNIIIEKFDPKYYGKVFRGSGETDYGDYKEINEVGIGNIDLTKSNIEKDGYVYVDLGTSYRDYLRYESLPKVLLKEELNIKENGEVQAIPKNSIYAKPLVGEIVLKNGSEYISLNTKGKEVKYTEDGSIAPKEYSLKLKLSIKEYKKLKPDTEYEIFNNGEQNVLTIGTDKLNDNIIFNKTLSFNTIGPSLKITNGIIDFGKIKPKNEEGPIINKEGKTTTPLEVRITGTLDKDLGITNQELIVEKDTIFINQVNAHGIPMENGGKLKVKDLKTVKKDSTIQTDQSILERYDVQGILEVDKNISEEYYGNYKGSVTVVYTFY